MKQKKHKNREQKKIKRAEQERIQKERKEEKRRDIIFYSMTAVLLILVFIVGAQ